MLQCKHIETMSQQAKVDLLNALIVTREGYEGKELIFTDCGLCSGVHWNSGAIGEYHLKRILFEQFNTYQYPFNDVEQGDIDYWEEEDKSTNPKRVKFLNELIEALEASIV